MAESPSPGLHKDTEMEQSHRSGDVAINPRILVDGNFSTVEHVANTAQAVESPYQRSPRPESSATFKLPTSGQPLMSDDTKKRLVARQLLASQKSKHTNLGNSSISHTGDRTAASDQQDENAWMEDDLPEGGGDADEDEAYERAAAEYLRKADLMENTFEDDIKFRSLQKKRNAQQLKANEEARNEFVDDFEEGIEGSLFVRDADDEDDAGNGSHTAKRRKTKDNSVDDGHMVMLENLMVLEMEKEAAAASKSKKNGTSKRCSKPSKVPTTKSKGKAKSMAPLKKMSKKKIREQQNLLSFGSLTQHDVFKHAETNLGRGDLPSFQAKTKREAMKELMSSLPLEERRTAELDKAQILNALKDFTGTGTCKSDGNGQWRVNGMKSSLSHYQMLGVAAMRRRERQEEEPRGGILADAMGLGKTVMMIANIVNGRHLTHGRPTLIVAPSSIICQWMAEIAKHAEKNKIGEVIRHHAGNRISSNDTVESLSKCGIIVTSYNEIAKSYPKWDPPIFLTTTEQKTAWWEDHYEKNRGPLHRIDFHRVILDEAQAIKNHKSQTSIAARGLSATHRWAISGTPVQNSLSEFFPYFKFLRVPFTGSFKVFKRNFCTPDDPSGIERLGLYLSLFMIRRGHNDTLMGAKLLNLPKPSRSDYVCHFSDLEREIYSVVRTRFVLRINGFSLSGQLQKKYNHILTMLLRLRQLVSHPLLIQDTLRDLLEPEDFATLQTIIKEKEKEVEPHTSQAAIIQHLREMLRAPKALIQLDETSSSAASVVGDDELARTVEGEGAAASAGKESVIEDTPATKSTPDTTSTSKVGGAFGLKDSWPQFVEDLRETSGKVEEEVEVLCCRCKVVPHDLHITSCQHIYCHECLRIMSYEAGAANKGHAKCLSCGEEYSGCQAYQPTKPSKKSTSDDGPPGATLDGEVQEKSKKSDRSDAKNVIDTWVDANGHMLPSAKTLAIKAQLMNWLQENPRVKIIVYSQFLTMIRIVSKMCVMEGWGYSQFTGLMNMERRSQVVTQFETDPGMSIMIASLKTGGTGLNLTCASRVLMVDLWWNSAVEYQAFCRTYRHGQIAETAMTRLIVHNTVDVDIIKMQQRKDAEIGHILSDGDQRRKKLTIRDLMSLFGDVDQDDDGRSFIMVDDRELNRRSKRYAPVDDDDTIMSKSVAG